MVGGNVSLYNESPAGVVDPTPTIAMVGLIENEGHITTQFFKSAGDVVILLGDFGEEHPVAGAGDPGPGRALPNDSPKSTPGDAAPTGDSVPGYRASLGATHFLKIIHGLKAGRHSAASFMVSEAVLICGSRLLARPTFPDAIRDL